MENNLETKEKRISYSEEAENLFESELLKEGIQVKSTKKIIGWTPYMDLIDGDYMIENTNINVDIKRNSISKKSLFEFRGKYFVVYHHFLKEARIYRPQDIKNKIKDADFEKLSSGDLGIKLKKLKELNISCITLEEFISQVKNN